MSPEVTGSMIVQTIFILTGSITGALLAARKEGATREAKGLQDGWSSPDASLRAAAYTSAGAVIGNLISYLVL